MEATSIFITDASGAVGRDLTRQLTANGHQVMGAVQGFDAAGLVRQDGGLPAYPDLLRAGEIRSNMQAAKASIIIHAAAQIPNQVPMRDAQWEHSLALLTEGTTAIIEAAKAAGVKFLVYLSYAALYGDTHGALVDENAPVSGSTEVLRAAIQAEQRVLNAGIPAVVLRAGYLYGAASPALMSLRDAILTGKNIPPGVGYANWVHGADLANAIMLALEKQPVGQIINIVDNHPTKPSDFTAYLATALGVSAPGTPPSFLLRLDKTQAALLNASVKVSNAKASAVLGWVPHYTHCQAGLEQTLLTWRINAAAGA